MKRLIVLFSAFGFFVGNCFAMERTAEYRKLYNELRNVQKVAPSSLEAQNSSSEVFKARTSKAAMFLIESAYIYGYESLLNSKHFRETGMESSFQGNLCSDVWGRAVVNFFNQFTEPGHLQWVAFLHNKHGVDGPFSYNASEAGTNDWDNPILGTTYTMFTGGDAHVPITRYGVLEGYFKAVDDVTQNKWDHGSRDQIQPRLDRIKTSLEQAIKNAQPA